MDNKEGQTRVKPKNGIDKSWFAAADLSMFAAAMIVKPRIGFGYIFPLIFASPWLATAVGHYRGRHPHFVSGFGYSLLTLHAFINSVLHLDRTGKKSMAYRRQIAYMPLLIGLAGLNFYEVGKGIYQTFSRRNR